MTSTYLKDLEDRNFVQLTKEEKSLWGQLEEIIYDLSEGENSCSFELVEEFDDPDFDEKSASMGYEIGLAAFAEELFERIVVANRFCEEFLQPDVLH